MILLGRRNFAAQRDVHGGMELDQFRNCRSLNEIACVQLTMVLGVGPELDFGFVLYNEADNTFHFEGTASRDVFDVLTQHPDYYVAPQRYEKGWGGIPRFVLQGNLSRTMNKCDPKLPRLAYT